MQRPLGSSLLIAIGLVSATAVPTQQRQGEDVIAVERAALDRWAQGDPSGFLTTYADDITYFDPMQDRRVDGLSTLRTMFQPLSGKFKIDRYEILNPKVQQSGDIAVLTYNLQNYAKLPDGSERIFNRWNSTAVFRRSGGKWRTIHSHWSFTKPELK